MAIKLLHNPEGIVPVPITRGTPANLDKIQSESITTANTFVKKIWIYR
ncbi:MAG: hypothetical protein CM15mV96_180 [uncultured marine virus]|nr:MAG: hypothetical protein CM15mV96_180 [uncultured marine virus]